MKKRKIEVVQDVYFSVLPHQLANSNSLLLETSQNQKTLLDETVFSTV